MKQMRWTGTRLLLVVGLILGVSLEASAEEATGPERIAALGAVHPGHTPRRVSPRYVPVRRRVLRKRFYFVLGSASNFVAPQEGSSLSQILGQGGGFLVSFGRRLSSRLATETTLFMTFHQAGPSLNFDSAVLIGISADAKLFLLPWATRLEPYIQLGLGGYVMARDGIQDPLEGFGFQAGIGVDYRLSSTFSLSAKLLYRGAYLDNREARAGFFPTEIAFISMAALDAGVKISF